MFCNTWTHWIFKAQATHCAIIDIPVTLMSRYTLTCQCFGYLLFTWIPPHLVSLENWSKHFSLLIKSFNNDLIYCSLEFLHTCVAGELKSDNFHCWSSTSTMISLCSLEYFHTCLVVDPTSNSFYCSLEFLHTCLAGELKSNTFHCWSSPSTMILFIIIFDCSTSSIVDHWFATLKIFTWSWLMIFLHSPL